MLARAATAEERQALAEMLGCHLTPGARGIVAVSDTGKVRGCAVFDVWTENSVQCHVATDTPMAWKALAPAGFSYAFQEAGRQVIIAMVRGTNSKSLAALTHLGFSERGRISDGYSAGDDLVLLSITRREWLAQRVPGMKRRKAA